MDAAPGMRPLLGSVAGAESGAAGATSAVTTALRYDAFGQTIGTYPATGSSLAVRYRGLIDLAPTADPDVAGTGSDPLYAMGARRYAPHLGAFTSFDTYAGEAHDPASLNRYLYAHANPATLIDPTGHRVCEADCQGDPTQAELEHSQDTAVETGSASGGTTPISNPRPTSTNQGTTSTGGTTPSTTTPVLTAGGAVPPGSPWDTAALVFGNINAAVEGVKTAGGEFVLGAISSTADLALCASAMTADALGWGCSPRQLASDLSRDWDGTTTAIHNQLADGITSTRADLLSGDPYRVSHAVATVFLTVGAIGSAKVPGRGAQLQISADRPVILRRPNGGSTLAQDAQIRAYADACNRALCAGNLSPTGRISTSGSLHRLASRAAARERATHPDRYGKGQHAGHAPDATWTGRPEPSEWLALDAEINTSLGGQAGAYSVGYKPTGFWFVDDFVAQFGAR